jgi:hypothetical protein
MATIRTAADKITATVSAFGKVKESQFNEGSYQSVLFEGGGLPEGKVWRSMTPDQAQGFTRGQAVYLVPTTNKQGKPSYDIELIAPATTTTPQATAQAPSHQAPANAREAYLETLERVGNRYQACITKAKQIWLTQYSEGDLAALPELLHTTATTLFIEANRMTR